MTITLLTVGSSINALPVRVHAQPAAPLPPRSGQRADQNPARASDHPPRDPIADHRPQDAPAESNAAVATSVSAAPAGSLDDCNAPGDFDGNGRVDLGDYASFAPCVQGPNTPVAAGCEPADTDNDGDADLVDFGALQSAFVHVGALGMTCPDTPAVVPGETALDYWRVVVTDARARGAVCNDGCPYVYYVRPGRNGNASKWMIFLKGGGSCGTIEGCNERSLNATHWMRPRVMTWRPPREGIFNPDTTRNPDWGDWTLVYLHYCSSDTFIGNREASCDSGGWHFRGKSTVTAVLEDLMNTPAGLPSLANATEVMFMGGSAGAIGVRQNLDMVHDMLSPIPVVGVHDSAVNVAAVPGAEELGIQYWTGASNLWHAEPDASCLDAEPDPIDCIVGNNLLLNHVSTPYFLFMDQFDAAALDEQRIWGFCFQEQCVIDDDCDAGQACLSGVCMGPACDAITPCLDGFCNEQQLCYGTQCVDDVECPQDYICNQGFCAREPLFCSTDADCGPDAFCAGGQCARHVDCHVNADCNPGETCIQDLEICVHPPECSSNADCGPGELCLSRRLTPYAQQFAFQVRELMQPLPGAFCTRWGTHVLLVKPRFFDGHISGLNYATVLANWYFSRPGPTNVIDYP